MPLDESLKDRPDEMTLAYAVHIIEDSEYPSRNDTYAVIESPDADITEKVAALDPGADPDFFTAYVRGMREDIADLNGAGSSLDAYVRYFVNEIRFDAPAVAEICDDEGASIEDVVDENGDLVPYDVIRYALN